MAISMLKIRRPLGRLIFNMGIAIPGKTVFLIETAPRDFGLGLKGMAAFKCWGFLLKAPATTGLIAYEWDTYLLWYS